VSVCAYVCRGDGWSDIVRKMSLDMEHKAGEIHPGIAIFVISFVAVVGMIIINILIAILLEGVTQAIDKAEREQCALAESKEHHKVAGPLDPLLATLANFTSEAHLEAQIKILFQILDVDDNNTLSFDEFKAGLAKMTYRPPISITMEDWLNFTNHGEWCDDPVHTQPQQRARVHAQRTHTHTRTGRTHAEKSNWPPFTG